MTPRAIAAGADTSSTPRVAALVKVAAPAVAGALREIDPAERARIAALFLALGPLTDLTPLLGTDIAAAARGALEEIQDR